MKNILCFGDSNTWGYAPISGARYSLDSRWPSVLQDIIGGQYHIVVEALNGRTIASSEAERKYRSGIELLPALLESHSPLDLVIVMLGTNDLKHCFDLSAVEIAKNIKQLCLMIIDNEHVSFKKTGTKILLISPSQITTLPEEDLLIFKNGIEKSKLLAENYLKVAKELSIDFFDAHTIVRPTSLDGIHWTPEQHRAFASSLSLKVKQILDD